MTVLIAPGTCRHCGCTEDNACRLSCSDTCCWVDRTRLVCSNPACVNKEAARLAAARGARPRKLRSWEIEEERANKRRESRRKSRAA